jgi:hypothetical protein
MGILYLATRAKSKMEENSKLKSQNLNLQRKTKNKNNREVTPYLLEKAGRGISTSKQLLLNLFVNNLLESFKRLGANQSSSINKKRRGAVDANFTT